MDGFDCDVLIVGLGPVGAALAGLLCDAGLTVIAVERERTVYPLPRAAHFDHEIMRLFQRLRIADEVLMHARPAPGYEFRTADGGLLVSVRGRAQASPSGWASGYMFNQPGLEHALRSKLARSSRAEILLGERFERLAQDGAGVDAVVAGPAGERRYRCRYLIGCDGARSAVREAIGSGLSSYDFDEPWLVVDAVVKESHRLPAVNLQICDPARPTTCVLMGPGRHRWEFMMLPGETAEEVLREDFIHGLLARWDVGGAIAIDRKAVYRFHGLVAERWRSGRVLLAGDSAHQTPPFAGQGMCAGLRDAANLSWKLKAVVRDGAGEALLDTYQAEREPNVRAYIELAIAMGRIVCTLDPAAAADRDRRMLAALAEGRPALPPATPPPMAAGVVMAETPAAGTLFPQPWSGAGADTLRLDDVLGDGAWLITAAQPAADEVMAAVRTGSLADPDLRPFREALSAWLDERGVSAVLVRPDRHVFGTGTAGMLVRRYVEHLGGAGRSRPQRAEPGPAVAP